MFSNVLESINNTMSVILRELAIEYNIDYDLFMSSYNAIIGGQNKKTCKQIIGNRNCKFPPTESGFCKRHTKDKPIIQKKPLLLETPMTTSIRRFATMKSGDKLVSEKGTYILRSEYNPVIYLKQGEDGYEQQLSTKDIKYCLDNCLPVCPEILKKFKISDRFVLPPVTRRMVENFSDVEKYDDQYFIHKMSGYIFYKHEKGPVVVARKYLHYETFLTEHDWMLCNDYLIASQPDFNFKEDDVSQIKYDPPIREDANTIQLFKHRGSGFYKNLHHSYDFVLEKGKFVVHDNGNFTLKDAERIEEYENLQLGAAILNRLGIPPRQINDTRTVMQRKHGVQLKPTPYDEMIEKHRTNIPTPYNGFARDFNKNQEKISAAKIENSPVKSNEIPEICEPESPVKSEISEKSNEIESPTKSEISESKSNEPESPAKSEKSPAKIDDNEPVEALKAGQFYCVGGDEYVCVGTKYTFSLDYDGYSACNSDEFKNIEELDKFEARGFKLGRKVLFDFGIGEPDKKKNPPSARVMFRFVTNRAGKSQKLTTTYVSGIKKTYKLENSELVHESSGIIFNDDLKVVARVKEGGKGVKRINCANFNESDINFIEKKMGFEILNRDG